MSKSLYLAAFYAGERLLRDLEIVILQLLLQIQKPQRRVQALLTVILLVPLQMEWRDRHAQVLEEQGTTLSPSGLQMTT